jgi:hypothetical protein
MHMFKNARVLAAAGCLLFAQNALADLPFKAGDNEITFDGSLSKTKSRIDRAGTLNDGDATVLVATGTYGIFLNEQMMLGIIAGVGYFDYSGVDDSYTDALGGLAFDVNFPTDGSPVVPVVGVLARTVLFDSESDYTVGVNGGVRLLVATDISVNVRAYFERTERQEDNLDDTFTAETYGVRVGFTWLLH